jgi:hypothetical protein
MQGILVQIRTDMKGLFHYRPVVYSVQLKVKPVLSFRISKCCVVTVGNLISALPLTLQHQMSLSNAFIHSFPSKRKLRRHGNNFQTTDNNQRRSEGKHSAFVKNFRLHSRTFKRGSTEKFVARGRFVNWFGEQV